MARHKRRTTSSAGSTRVFEGDDCRGDCESGLRRNNANGVSREQWIAFGVLVVTIRRDRRGRLRAGLDAA